MTTARNIGISALALLLGLIVPATGQAQQSRFAITPQRVAGAMADAGWVVRPEQVKLLSQVTSSSREAWLQVVQVAHWQGDKLKVELRCRDPRACLPFYVLVQQAGMAGKPGQTLSGDERAGPPASHTELEMTTEKPLLRSGDPATLTFADNGLHISMPVICLENGYRGQTIRVASADHKRFYKAEIVGPGLLKATTL